MLDGIGNLQIQKKYNSQNIQIMDFMDGIKMVGLIYMEYIKDTSME